MEKNNNIWVSGLSVSGNGFNLTPKMLEFFSKRKKMNRWYKALNALVWLGGVATCVLAIYGGIGMVLGGGVLSFLNLLAAGGVASVVWSLDMLLEKNFVSNIRKNNIMTNSNWRIFTRWVKNNANRPIDMKSLRVVPVLIRDNSRGFNENKKIQKYLKGKIRSNIIKSDCKCSEGLTHYVYQVVDKNGVIGKIVFDNKYETLNGAYVLNSLDGSYGISPAKKQQKPTTNRVKAPVKKGVTTPKFGFHWNGEPLKRDSSKRSYAHGRQITR